MEQPTFVGHGRGGRMRYYTGPGIREINMLIDQVADNLEIYSDRALSIAFDLDPSAIWSYRTGKMLPSDEVMIKLAESAMVSPQIALCDLAIWRAKSDAAREAWGQLRALAERAATVALFVLAFLFVTPGTRAEQITIATAQPIHYATRRRRAVA